MMLPAIRRRITTLTAERDDARAIAERQQGRIRSLIGWGNEVTYDLFDREAEVAQLAFTLATEHALTLRLQRQIDGLLRENHRLRAAATPGGRLAALRPAPGSPSRVERDPVVRQMRDQAA